MLHCFAYNRKIPRIYISQIYHLLGDIIVDIAISAGVIIGVIIMGVILLLKNTRFETLNFYAMVVINTARELIKDRGEEINKIDPNLFEELQKALESMELALTDESITLKEGLEYILSFSILVDRVMNILDK